LEYLSQSFLDFQNIHLGKHSRLERFTSYSQLSNQKLSWWTFCDFFTRYTIGSFLTHWYG